MGTVRTAVSLPEEVFASLDQMAKRAGKSRSAVVAEAVEELARSERDAQAELSAQAPVDLSEESISVQTSRQRIARLSRLLDEQGDIWEP